MKFFSQTLGGYNCQTMMILELKDNKKLKINEEFMNQIDDRGFCYKIWTESFLDCKIDPKTARDFRNAIEYDIVKGTNIHLVFYI